jgi:putative ABC transport system permease protein
VYLQAIFLVTLIGSQPNGQLFKLWNIIQGNVSSLREPYTVIADETKLHDLNVQRIGDAAAIGPLPARLVGLTRGSQSIVMSDFLHLAGKCQRLWQFRSDF